MQLKNKKIFLLGRRGLAAFLASDSLGRDERRGWLLLPVVLSAAQWRPAASAHYAAQCFPASSSRTHVRALERCISRSITRKKIYALNRLPLYDPRAAIEGRTYLGRGVGPRKGCNRAL